MKKTLIALIIALSMTTMSSNAQAMTPLERCLWRAQVDRSRCAKRADQDYFSSLTSTLLMCVFPPACLIDALIQADRYAQAVMRCDEDYETTAKRCMEDYDGME